jgi:hypothetical protein
MEENGKIGQNPQGIVIPTEDSVTVEQRKNYKEAKSFLHFIPWNIYHQKLLKQKLYPFQAKICT